MRETVAYIRVSSKGQDHAMQRAAVEKATAARGDSVAEWYAEKRTASTLDRPELARLLADVRARKVGRLYVYRLDRLTRSGIVDTLALVRELRELGVELVNLADGFTIPAPGVEGSAARIAELVLAILAWAADMELLTRRERIATRRELAEERGEPWGRPGRLSLGEHDAIAARLDAGETVRQVAAALKVPRSTVGRVARKLRPRPGGAAGWGRRSSLSRNPPPSLAAAKPAPASGEPPSSEK